MSRPCPRCESSLAEYVLAGTAASVCESCGYVGVEADHSGDPVVFESWDEALQRFQDR